MTIKIVYPDNISFMRIEVPCTSAGDRGDRLKIAPAFIGKDQDYLVIVSERARTAAVYISSADILALLNAVADDIRMRAAREE